MSKHRLLLLRILVILGIRVKIIIKPGFPNKIPAASPGR